MNRYAIAAFRNAVGLVPLELGIDRGVTVLLPLIDPVFRRFEDHQIRVHDLPLQVSAASPHERVIAYFIHNLLHKLKRTPLFSLMKELYHDESDVFIDIGANFGLYSFLAKIIGYKSILFEPQSTCFEFLRRNPVLGDAHNVALSSTDGDSEFFIGRNVTASSLVPVAHENGAQTYVATSRVKVRRAASAIAEASKDASKIKLIKIDVEGAEADVIEGLQDLLSDISPAIWCEVRGPQSDRNPNSYRTVQEILARFGYQGFHYRGTGVTPFRPDEEAVPQVFDLIFLNRSLKELRATGGKRTPAPEREDLTS